MASVVFVGFDSAWTDSQRAPGAICSVRLENGKFVDFRPPFCASFDDALAFINRVSRQVDLVLIAIDQPTIVNNPTGMRPAERVAASVISWLGGGVQPANRGRVGMFDDAAPIWRFLSRLNAVDDPLRARGAIKGRFVMEVFPALALASLDDRFCGRLQAPRYNPKARTFRFSDLGAVISAASMTALRLNVPDAAAWCSRLANRLHERPSRAQLKIDQDQLDALLCMLIAIIWWSEDARHSVMVGDLRAGYIVAPASVVIRERLKVAALSRAVTFR